MFSDYLAHEKMVNSKAKPYRCEKCPKAYPSLSSLRRHCVVWNHGDIPTRDEINQSKMEENTKRMKEHQAKEVRRCQELFNEMDKTEDSYGYLTFSLQDGNVAVNKLHLLFGSEFFKSILRDEISSDEFITCSKIIIPDMSIELFQKFVELISNGVTHFESIEDLDELVEWSTGVFMYHNIYQYEEVRIQNKQIYRKDNDSDGNKMSTLKNIHARKDTSITEISSFPDKADGNASCRYCLKRFTNHSIKRRHEDICEKNLKHSQRYECEQCGHKTLTQRGLDTHIDRKHKKEMNSSLYECESCPKKYKSIGSLKRHCNESNHPYPMKDENGDNKNKCKICLKIVKNIDEHMKKHGKKHKCTECDYSSPREDTLNRHMKLVHKLHDLEFGQVTKSFASSSKVIYTCPQCKKECKSEEAVKHHLSLVKCQENRCTECGLEFSMKHHLKSHMKTHRKT